MYYNSHSFHPKAKIRNWSPPLSQVHPEVQVFGYDLTYHTWSLVTAWTSPNSTLFLHPTFFIYSNTAKRISFKNGAPSEGNYFPFFWAPFYKMSPPIYSKFCFRIFLPKTPLGYFQLGHCTDKSLGHFP